MYTHGSISAIDILTGAIKQQYQTLAPAKTYAVKALAQTDAKSTKQSEQLLVLTKKLIAAQLSAADLESQEELAQAHACELQTHLDRQTQLLRESESKRARLGFDNKGKEDEVAKLKEQILSLQSDSLKQESRLRALFDKVDEVRIYNTASPDYHLGKRLHI